jgi:hypothetical protein
MRDGRFRAITEILTVQREALVDAHPDVGVTPNNLGFLLYVKGDVDEALDMRGRCSIYFGRPTATGIAT